MGMEVFQAELCLSSFEMQWQNSHVKVAIKTERGRRDSVLQNKKNIKSPHKCQLRDLWLTLVGENSPNAVANLLQISSLQREQHCYSICSTSIFTFVSVICWDFAHVCMGSTISNMISKYSCSCRAELCSTSAVLVAGRFLGALLAIKPLLCVTL